MAQGPADSVHFEAHPPQSVRLVRVCVPLINHHVSAFGSETSRDVILVAWTDRTGSTGWAECSTLTSGGYATETTGEAWSSLVEGLVPDALAGRAEQLSNRPGAQSVLADAGLDAMLRGQGLNLSKYLAVGAGWSVETTVGAVKRCVVVADLGATPDEVARRAADAVDAGAAMVKVKISPGNDRDVLAAVIDRIGPVPVAADANGSYGHPRDLGRIDRLGLAYLEQPLSPVGDSGVMSVAELGLETPVALDESIGSLAALERLIERSAMDIVSVKPLRLGGVVAAAGAMRAATDAGLGAFVGGMVELGLGRSAALAVASLPGCSLPTDLGPSGQYVADDICEPIVLDETGSVLVPSGPGCGRLPEEAVIARFAIDDVTLER